MIDRRFSVAPMIDWSDRHFRYLMRLLSSRALLYSEMITTGALRYGDRARHLDFSPVEHPVALQIGGSEPDAMAECARMAEEWGYDEVNINVGCPSDRVQNGCFGARLMAEPERVAACVAAMRAAVRIPVTVKTRIGVDDRDRYEHLAGFVETVASAGCEVFIVHARKAWLQGLSPRENREIPPLRYDTVARLKSDFPELTVVLNGGVRDLDTASRELARFDGVMVGRGAYSNPGMIAEVDRSIFDAQTVPSDLYQVLAAYTDYVAEQHAGGVPLQRMTRHVLPLFQGVPGARRFRRYISENAHRPGAGAEVLERAAAMLGEVRAAA